MDENSLNTRVVARNASFKSVSPPIYGMTTTHITIHNHLYIPRTGFELQVVQYISTF